MRLFGLKNCPICGDKMKFDTEPHEKWVNVTFGTHDTVIEQYFIVVHATDHEDGLTEKQATCPFRMPLRAMPTKAMAARQWNERADEYTRAEKSRRIHDGGTMKRYLVTVPDDGRHYEIYTPIEDGIRGVVTCAECRFSKKNTWSFSGEQWLVCSKIAFAEVQNDHFCSWGEPEQPFAE